MRHASISWNGWVFGQTWSPFANLTALPNTIESGLTSITSTWAHRNIVAGRNIEVNDSLSVGVFLEDWGYDENTNRSVPDFTINTKLNLDITTLFLAARILQRKDEADATTTETSADYAFGIRHNITDSLQFRGGLTYYDKDDGLTAAAHGAKAGIYSSASLSYDFSERLNSNLVYHYGNLDENNSDQSAVAVNMFYDLPVGLQLGIEWRSAFSDRPSDEKVIAGGLGDGDHRLALQARFSF